MSMIGSAGASGMADDILKYIQGGGLEKKVGRPIEGAEKQTVELIVDYIRSAKESADSGWW
jgi:hypothetical protein